jgi:hypothetical protein
MVVVMAFASRKPLLPLRYLHEKCVRHVTVAWGRWQGACSVRHGGVGLG